MLEKISQDINAALKSGDKATAEALRLLKSALLNGKIAVGHELNDDESIAVVRREIKARIEARDLFSDNDRQSQADKEEFERILFSKYVPEQLTAEVIDGLIAETSSELIDSNFGTLMSAVMKKINGKADGKLVSERVKYFLEGK
jgi:hypothetical protein